MLIAVFPAFARDVEIIVEDTELGLPLEGAAIRSWDGRQYLCDENGRAVVTAPDDRQAVIQAAYPGYENGRLVITAGDDCFTIGLRLSGIMENRELVLEASKPGESETKTGRSVAVSAREIAQTAEIGLVEDVMSSIKLLPGVGYAGFMNAMPSIRGGDPGDMTASLDGFYILNPYFWGGGYSIFDPRMVQSAQLSHGVFSARYGHSISGLLDISSKKPSPADPEFELSVNTSAANFNLSVPITGRGGVLFMGRVTYYDPFIGLAKQLSKVMDSLEVVNSIRVAPFIRSGTVTGNYRFMDNLELSATGFWGMDGIGYTFENGPEETPEMTSSSKMVFDWTNYQGFATSALAWNPRSDMLLKFSAGTGYEKALVEYDERTDIENKYFSNEFKNNYGFLSGYYDISQPYRVTQRLKGTEGTSFANAQGRLDYDWEPGNGFLVAAGAQEMFTRLSYKTDSKAAQNRLLGEYDEGEQALLLGEMGIDPNDPALAALLRQYLYINSPVSFESNLRNSLLTSSGYALAEFSTKDRRFGAELGLRVDHYYLLGADFNAASEPALNPRLNLDFNLFKNKGVFQSLDLSAGTGLFSSTDLYVFLWEKKYGIDKIVPSRSWTSVLGAKLELPEGVNFNVEGYYKHIFNRMYYPISFDVDGNMSVQPQFNGKGRSWGIDMMLQKTQSRFWDGWISYSWNWTKYRDPDAGNADMGFAGGDMGNGWYYPYYHRFHNLNLVLNIKPAQRFNIYTRFGLAGGIPLLKRLGDKPQSYPVWVHDPENGGKLVEEYYWPEVEDESNRTTISLPLDIKFSIYGKRKNSKAHYEVYVAVENVFALLSSQLKLSQGNTSFNSYTGEIDQGSNSASYEMPIPVPSFGIKYSY